MASLKSSHLKFMFWRRHFFAKILEFLTDWPDHTENSMDEDQSAGEGNRSFPSGGSVGREGPHI